MDGKKVCVFHWGTGFPSEERIATAYCDFCLFKHALGADHVSLIPPTTFSVANVKDFLDYDILFFDGWAVEDLTDAIARVKDIKPAIQIYFFECGSLDMIFNQGGPADRAYLAKKWVNSFDRFLTYSEQSFQFYDAVFPGKVYFVGCPIEMKKASQLKAQTEKRTQVLLFGDTGYMGNLINHLVVARLLPDVEKVIIVPNLGEYASFINCFNGFRIPNLKFSDLLSHEDFVRVLCESKACIALTGKVSFGRMALMGALLGTPVIGPNVIQNQDRLFPDLTVSPWDMKGAAAALRRLLESGDNYYHTVRQQAFEQVKNFSLEACAKRFWEVADVSV